MTKKIIAVFALALSASSFAQGIYPAERIPKDLLAYAGAVIRNDETTIEIKDKEHVLYHYKRAITVLNRNGDDEARLVIPHNKDEVIESIKGTVYNEYGKAIGKIAERGFEDNGYWNEYTLFEDIRFKHFKPSVTDYPYTVEYDYAVRSKQSLNIDWWVPLWSEGVSVENSSYKIICDPRFNLRYKQNNFPSEVITAIDAKGNKIYEWRAANLKAIKPEPYSPNRLSYVPSVRVALQDFFYDGYAGTYSNWQDLGKWIYDALLVNRRKLDPETLDKVKELTAGITDPKEKARKIYEYMQQKTRYVSVQIGIGGYQPFPAADVDRLGYGDCKGLVNYTQAMLKAADIDSYYCVVKSGSEKASLMKDFASMNQADHIILCLPFKNDTTWLECTSQHIPFGFLGNFTDDRWVLACTPEGGKLLHTPTYTAEQNREWQKADFTLDETGKLSGAMQTTFSGTQYENRDGLMLESQEEQLKAVRKLYPINNMDIGSYQLSPKKSPLPQITEDIKLSAPEYASMENGKLFFMVNSVNRIENVPRQVRNRNTPLYIERGFTDVDEIRFNLPAGYRPARNMLNIHLDRAFGSYTANLILNGNHLVYNRTLKLREGTYAKEDYDQLVDFLQAVFEADNYTMTLTKDKN